jgi:hypothetical protein
MRKHIELKRFDQGTALTTGKLALPPLVIELIIRPLGLGIGFRD